MNNFNLKRIQKRGDNLFLETSFYSLPVFTSEELIKSELKKCLNESAEDVLESGKVELFWIDEKNNLAVLEKLLFNDESVLFLPEKYRIQVINAQKRQQPCYFFVEKGIGKNFRGSWELRLRQSCEAEPHKKGYKHGYNLSIVLGSSIHEIKVDGNLKIVDIVELEDIILLNTVF